MPPKKLKINFNKKFNLPSSDQILHALNTPGKKTQLNDKKFKNLLKFFGDIRMPTHELDWLVRYNEKGQDCEQFYKNYSNILLKRNGNRKTVYYVKIGEFKNLDFSSLVEYSKIFFDCDLIKTLPYEIKIQLIKNDQNFQIKAFYENLQANLEFRYDKKSKNFQIKTLSLNLFLKKIRPRDTCCLIGFTEYDLYVEDSDLFVAGLCNGNLGVGVFSIMRYHPKLNFSEENWFEYKQSKIFDDRTWLIRSCRLMVHETCHLLGLAHCKYKDCCMNGSGHLKEDFKQSMFLCPIDLKKLWLILGFNLSERYEKLKHFFDKNKCKKESKLLQIILSEFENLK